MHRFWKRLIIAGIIVAMIGGTAFLIYSFSPDPECNGFETPQSELAEPSEC